jgi:hypothetical protein
MRTLHVVCAAVLAAALYIPVTLSTADAAHRAVKARHAASRASGDGGTPQRWQYWKDVDGRNVQIPVARTYRECMEIGTQRLRYSVQQVQARCNWIATQRHLPR